VNNFESEIQQSVDFLKSDTAHKMLAEDPYWPKWHSPWWHMLLLFEMGEVQRIPSAIVDSYVTSLNRIPLKIFPIHPGELPEGVDPFRGTPCHCQLGNVYQVLTACGVDVDQRLPWIRPWLLRYQMADGGMNCDNDAYLVTDEVPSSMVGMISAFEAILLCTNRPWTEDEKIFLQKGAQFLIDRKLTLGSPTKHNAAERESAQKWPLLCFPRFYLYDVLRGLSALTAWSRKMQKPISAEAINHVIKDLQTRFPDGNIKIGRIGFDGTKTLLQNAEGTWERRHQASFFPLLTRVCEVGQISPALSKQWQKLRAQLLVVN
jgi:hypothetical protein